MITVRLSPDKKWLYTRCSTPEETTWLASYFIVKIPNWQMLQKKYPGIQTEQAFINDIGMIPVGLWAYLVNLCQRTGACLVFEEGFEQAMFNMSVSQQDFKSYVEYLFSKSDITPMPYQVESAYNLIKYRTCCAEISTSGGKTLMAYVLFRFFIDYLKLKHILYVTPATELTTQSYNKFRMYDKDNQMPDNWTGACIFAKAKKKKVYDDTIVFGNYQSLHRKDPSFFEKYDAVIIDEAHHSKADSILKILSRCTNAVYKIGMTGTFPPDGSFESFVVQSNIGPVVYRLTSFELINKHNFATPVYVTAINLKYLSLSEQDEIQKALREKDKDDVDEGGRIFNHEKKLVWNNPTRFDYICNMIAGTTKNSLVIYGDIQNGYGKRVYERLKQTTKKDVFFIEGSTDAKVRNIYKEAMENDATGNTIIVSSMGCFTEGIDIANLWNIFLIESTKSDNTLAQLLGRGMRRYPKKDKTRFIDIVDDFRSGVKGSIDNYLFTHGKKRQKIYTSRGFPLQVFDVDIRPLPKAKNIIDE